MDFSAHAAGDVLMEAQRVIIWFLQPVVRGLLLDEDNINSTALLYVTSQYQECNLQPGSFQGILVSSLSVVSV